MNTLFQNVLTASFHGSVVILVVLALRLALRKTPRKFICLLWLLVGVRLLMPFEIKSDLSLQPDPQLTQSSWEQQTLGGQRFLLDADTPQLLPQNTEVTPNTSNTPNTQHAAPALQPESQPEQTAAAPAQNRLDLMALLPYFWLAVVCCFGISTMVSYSRLKRQVRFAVKIPGGWECDTIDTAFILGFIRPKIYIPMGMDPACRRHILAHERTHLEKGDHWFKMVGYIALALHWFNPLVWVAYILLCKDIEMACDERVVQFMELEERKEYSKALLSCSTNSAHLAACPVAFGEVSVKDRIRTVLNYRKPGFWISLLGVAAIVFVAVCLVTSPTQKPEKPGSAVSVGETRPEGTMSVVASSFTDGMTPGEAVDACAAGIRELMERESYYIQTIQTEEDEMLSYVSDIRRAEGNKIAQVAGDGYSSGELWYGERYAMFTGSDWCWLQEISVEGADLDSWLSDYTPEGKEISNMEIRDGGTVAYHVQWEKDMQYAVLWHEADVVVTFDDDGSIVWVDMQDTYGEVLESGKREPLKTSRRQLLPQTETAEETVRVIREAADTAMTQEELEIAMVRREQVTEVPSNKTDYDKGFMLGSGEMSWKFMDGQWYFKFGAQNVTETSLQLWVEFCGPYGNASTVTGGSVEAGTEYFLEELVDGVWTTLPTVSGTFEPIQTKKLPTGSTQDINWEKNYGKLPGGFYRLGNYYTFTATDGTQDTQVCYAKFRIYDENQLTLLERCRSAVEKLKNQDAFHIYLADELLYENYTMFREYWKCGNDYLSMSYRTGADYTQEAPPTGAMWRDGKYYGLDAWNGDLADGQITDWWQSVDGYMDSGNFTMLWGFNFEWYDANVEMAYQIGNQVVIRSGYDYSEEYACEDIILTFDDQGNLKGMTKQYLPERNSPEKDKVTTNTLIVFDDSRDEIRKLIDGQNVSAPMPFSYAEDVAANPDAQTTGFRNTTAKPITGCADAVALADRESTLPQLMEFAGGYCQTKVYHDDTAGIWKVHLYWWQHDTCQDVYMTDDGITVMSTQVLE